jgi:Holliday junction resolvase RusA-like endonuclease
VTREALADRLPEVTTHRDWLRLCREVAAREGVKPATVSAAAIRLSQERHPRREGGADRADRYTRLVLLVGPAVGQSRPRVWAGGRVGQTGPSAWARERWRRAALTLPRVPVGVLAGVSITVRQPRHGKPDLDNVAKLILDAMADAGVLPDDAQVSHLEVRRVLSSALTVSVELLVGA